MPVPAQIQALINKEIRVREEHETPTVLAGCTRDGNRALDGTGAHLRLRAPWYNDLSHEITDSTIFRILLIVMVVEWILKKIG